MYPNQCSHGKTWKERCVHCELIWWLDVRDSAIKNIARANAMIVEINKELAKLVRDVTK